MISDYLATGMKSLPTSLFLSPSLILFGKRLTSTSCFVSFVASGPMRARVCIGATRAIHNHNSIPMPPDVLDTIERRERLLSKHRFTQVGAISQGVKRKLDVLELRQSVLSEYFSEGSLGAIKRLRAQLRSTGAGEYPPSLGRRGV